MPWLSDHRVVIGAGAGHMRAEFIRKALVIAALADPAAVDEILPQQGASARHGRVAWLVPVEVV